MTMRLCIIANPNSIHTQRWVRFFALRGHEVHLVGPNPLAGDLPEDLQALLADGRFHDLTQVTNRRKFRFALWSLTLRRLLRTLRPDVLHAHQVTGAGWLGAGAGYHPFLVTSWGSDLLVSARRSATQRRLASMVLRRADYVTCVSQPLAEAAQALGVPAHKVEVVHWGVDMEVFNRRDASAGPSMTGEGSALQGPLVLSIRGLRSLYNPLVIAQAIPIVLTQRPDVRFVIRTYSVDADLLATFQAIIGQGGAGGAVEYIGDLTDDHAIADLYRRAAVVISVPSSDGTPQSVLEAMACGAAPVISDLPSLRGWVRHEREGLVVPVGDSAALAGAILRLLDDKALSGSIRAAAAHQVQQRADSRLWMERYEQIYQQLAAGQRPRPLAAMPGEER
jgi:glycosyltransferase involved in cell wall biosynthesis